MKKHFLLILAFLAFICDAPAATTTIHLLDSTVTVKESSVFGNSKTLYQYNNKGTLIRRTSIYASWTKWKVGVPMIMNRKSVIVYDDEGHEIDLYYSSLDTATGKWTDDHRYLYDEWHNRTYSVGKWNADSTALLSGVRYFYDSNHLLIGNESFDTWNGVEVVTDRYFYTNGGDGYKIGMFGQFRPDSAYDGDYKSDPDKFNQSGWKNVDSAYYDRNLAGQSLRETFFRWDETNNQWLKDGYQDFSYDEQGHMLTDTVFARDFETNIILPNNYTHRIYDTHGNMIRSTNYIPIDSDNYTQWQINYSSINEYTYDENDLIVSCRSYTDNNDGAQPNYTTTTYYYTTHNIAEDGTIINSCTTASGTCGAQGDNLTWELSCDSVLTISGTGEMQDYSSQAPWYENRKAIKSVIIEEGATNVGSRVFANCINLTSIIIPSSVTSIGYEAFYNCTGLVSIDIPNSVTSIGKRAFYWCNDLSAVTMGNGITNIEEYAFYKCVSLESVNLSNNIQSIGNYAYAYCQSLTSIALPHSLTTMGEEVFGMCSSLISVSLSENLVKISMGTFDGCTALQSIIVPEGVQTIEARAFYQCKSLESIELPSTITFIDGVAFSLPISFETALKTFTCHAILPPSLGYNVFEYLNPSANLIRLYVPSQSIDAYTTADQWSDFMNIQPIGGHPSLSLPIHIELKDNYGRWLNEAAISNEHDTAFFYSSSFDYSEYLVYAYKAEDNLWRLIGHTTPEYRFIGWKDKDGKVLNQDTLCLYSSDTVTAVVSKQEYHVQVVPDNYMHGYIKAEYGYAGDTIISYGESINVTAIPREGYQFSNWSDWHTDNPRNIKILGDLYLTAIFDCKSYGGGWPSNLMDTITIERGDPVIISEGLPRQHTIYPTDTDYFNDTLLTIFGCDSIVTHYVIVTENKFPVIFLNYNGKVLSRQYVRNGMGAEEPEVPAREGYTFTGWTTDIEHITDTTYAIAVYNKIGGTVIYKAEDGEIIGSENVDLHLPVAPMISGKTFAGWLTESIDSESGIVLRATYTTDNPTTHDDVSVVPGSTTAAVNFPYITGALTYELVIRDLFGHVVCKILFNFTGHLLGIALAPGRDRSAAPAQTDGFNFTVEGLDPNTTYNYEFVAHDDTDEVIETLSGSFTTTDENSTGMENVQSGNVQCSKVLRNDHVYILRGDKTYTLQGQEVK